METATLELEPDVLSPDEITGIVKSITITLINVYDGAVEEDELAGWAGLGVAKALHTFDPSVPNADIRKWLKFKGRRIAQDEMRVVKTTLKKSGDGYQLKNVIHFHQMSAFEKDPDKTQSGGYLHNSITDPTDPHNDIDLVDAKHDAGAMLTTLTDYQRHLVELHLMEGTGIMECTKIIGNSFKTLKGELASAMTKMREFGGVNLN